MQNSHQKILYSIFIGIVITAIGLGCYFRAFDQYNLDMLDFLFWSRGKIPVTDKLVVIEIDDDTLKKLGSFPFDRSYHAVLIQALNEHGAKGIVFDMFFSEPQESDTQFAEAIRRAGNVYLPSVFEMEDEEAEERASAPSSKFESLEESAREEIFENSVRNLMKAKPPSRVPWAVEYTAQNLPDFIEVAKGIGHINVAPDVDGKFRRVPLYVKFIDTLHPYLSFLVSCDYLGLTPKEITFVPGKSITLAPGIKIPLDENSNTFVNFTGKWGTTFQHFSYVNILRSYLAQTAGEKPLMDLDVVKGKICLIGMTATGTADLHPNPLESLYPAVGMHADIFNSIITKNFVTRAPRELNVLALVLLAFLVGTTTYRSKPFKGFLLLIAISALIVEISILIFTYSGWWFDLSYILLILVFVYTMCTLYKYIREWKHRLVLENELQIAKRIQESFLPKTVPQTAGTDIAAAMFTAWEVGGDLYDFLEFNDRQLGVMIGDVSGKGIPASLFMAMTTGSFKFFAKPETRPEETLLQLNNKIKREFESRLFVTMCYSIFDMEHRTVSFANGGHLPLLYLAVGAPPKLLNVDEGFPLGMVEGTYSGSVIPFSSGDIFVFYTDGITEARNPKEDMYGSDRLLFVARQNRKLGAQDLLHAIERDVRKFEPKQNQHDDMTVIVIKII